MKSEVCHDCRGKAFEGYKVEVQRVPIDHGGYTKRGEYYGTGAPIFRSVAEHPEKDTLYFETRASDRAHARAIFVARYPGAKVAR